MSIDLHGKELGFDKVERKETKDLMPSQKLTVMLGE
jgi:hypothetical protein